MFAERFYLIEGSDGVLESGQAFLPEEAEAKVGGSIPDVDESRCIHWMRHQFARPGL